jgi:hypothetical protein
VRDAARKLAYGFHLLNLTKLRLGGLSLFRFLLECLVGFPKFLGPLANRDLKYFSTFGFTFGLTPGRSILAQCLERDHAKEHGPKSDDQAEDGEIVGEAVRFS